MLWMYDDIGTRGRRKGQKLRTKDGMKITKYGTEVDSRKNKSYAWEREVVNCLIGIHRDQLTQSEAKALVRKICLAHGSFVPKMYFYGSATSNYRHWFLTPEKSTMRFAPGWGMKRSVILHEIAHCLQHQYYAPRTDAGHSAIWLRIFIDLLVEYAGMDRTTLEQSAAKRRIPAAPRINYKPGSMSHTTQTSNVAGTASPEPVKRGRGRPPGSKNKPKEIAPVTQIETPKKRGRPPGSKNKLKI